MRTVRRIKILIYPQPWPVALIGNNNSFRWRKLRDHITIIQQKGFRSINYL